LLKNAEEYYIHTNTASVSASNKKGTIMMNEKQKNMIIEGTELFLSQADNETLLRYQKSDKKILESFAENTAKAAGEKFSAHIFAECLKLIFNYK